MSKEEVNFENRLILAVFDYNINNKFFIIANEED